MADYGLVLPEHDLTAADFKELARRIGRAAFVPLFLRYYERVITSEEHDRLKSSRGRALADIIARWIVSVEEDRKVDRRTPNLRRVFNIIFGAPGARQHAPSRWWR